MDILNKIDLFLLNIFKYLLDKLSLFYVHQNNWIFISIHRSV